MRAATAERFQTLMRSGSGDGEALDVGDVAQTLVVATAPGTVEAIGQALLVDFDHSARLEASIGGMMRSAQQL